MDRVRYRWVGLGALAATAVAVRVGLSTPAPASPDVVGAVERARTEPSSPSTADAITTANWSLDRSAISTPEWDPFALRTPPPPPPPAPLPPVILEAPRPSAPPLPFKFMGRLEGDHVNAVFVTHGNRVLTIEPGEQIDGNYRVESIGETEIVFSYLPLAERQVLPMR